MCRVESCVEWSQSKRAMMALDSKAGSAGSPKTSDVRSRVTGSEAFPAWFRSCFALIFFHCIPISPVWNDHVCSVPPCVGSM